MTLIELLAESKRENLVDLEALISFLVFEKKVQSLKDHKKCLDRYLLSKHQAKMNRLLTEYKRHKNLQPKPSYYMATPKIKSKERLFVIAYDGDQATQYLNQLGIQVSDIQIMLDDELIQETEHQYKQLKIDDFKKIPALIGKHERAIG